MNFHKKKEIQFCTKSNRNDQKQNENDFFFTEKFFARYKNDVDGDDNNKNSSRSKTKPGNYINFDVLMIILPSSSFFFLWVVPGAKILSK